jgi:hypothetical protein
MAIPRVDLKRVATIIHLSLVMSLLIPEAPSIELWRVPIDDAELLTKCA